MKKRHTFRLGLCGAFLKLVAVWLGVRQELMSFNFLFHCLNCGFRPEPHFAECESDIQQVVCDQNAIEAIFFQPADCALLAIDPNNHAGRIGVAVGAHFIARFGLACSVGRHVVHEPVGMLRVWIAVNPSLVRTVIFGDFLHNPVTDGVAVGLPGSVLATDHGG